MGEFTIYDDPRVDEHIKKMLTIIVEDILKEFNKQTIKAIILAGSFGRGEGGIVIDGKNIKLVNDFDINILVKFSKYIKINLLKNTRSLEYLSSTLANKVKIKQVDLSVSHQAKFYFKLPTIVENYEYLNGHKILFGDIEIRDIIKKIKAEDIPLDDGTKFFLTRGSGLLIAAIYFFKKDRIDIKDRENFLIEANKAILAMGDSFLILKHKYHYSYEKRLEIIKRVDFTEAPNGDEIKELYRLALEWKLRPNFNWASDKIEIQKWFYLKQLFYEFFIWFESKRLNMDFIDWGDYVKKIYSLQKDFNTHLPKRIYKLLKEKKVRKDFPAKLSILPALLFSLRNETTIDQELLSYGVENMYRFYGIEDISHSWKENVLKYLNIFHPGGVVKTILEENIG